MNAYHSLTHIKLSSAIIAMIELALPRFTRDKVLVINLVFQMKSERRILNLIIYRPDNYTFVGTIESLIQDPVFPLDSTYLISRKSYHDSCWKSDGIESTIGKFIQKQFKNCFDECDDCSVSFGIITPRFYDGILENMDSEERIAKFVPKNKEE